MNPLISPALLKEQFKRFWPIALFAIIGYLLFVIMPVYVHEGGRNTYQSAAVMLDVLSMRQPFVLLMTLALPFIVVMTLFSQLFSEKTAGFYSLADNKSQLFLTNSLAGAVLVLIPIIVSSLLLLITVRFPASFHGQAALSYPADLFSRGLASNAVINTFPVIAAFFARLAVSSLFYFTLFLLAVSISGKRAMAVALCVLLPFVPMTVYRFWRLVPSVYVLGFDSLNVPGTGEILSYANPWTWIWQSLTNGVAYVFGFANVAPPNPHGVTGFVNPITWHWNWGREGQGLYFVVYIAILLALAILAYLCFISRKTERANEPIVFRPLKNVMIFSLSVLGMVAMGGFFISLISGRWFLYYGFVLGFVLVFCMAQMLFEKSFNIMSKMKWLMPQMGVAAVLYGIMLLITMLVMRPYTHYVPDINRVAGVYVSFERRWVHNDAFITDPEIIRETVAFHERILDIRSDLTARQIRDMRRDDRRNIRTEQRDHRRDVRNANWQALSGGGRLFAEDGGRHLYITYLLTNGETIYRRYALSGALIGRLGGQNPLLAGLDTLTVPRLG